MARSEAAEGSKAKINISSSPKPTQTPFPQRGLQRVNGEGTKINISSIAMPQKRDRPGSVGGRPSSRSGETLQDWEDRILSGIFRMTLDSGKVQDLHGHNLHYVSGVREDLEEQGEAVRFNTAILDQAILEAASNLAKTPPLEYLLACWKRVSRHHKGFKSGRSEDPKFAVIKEARRLCMSYCIFAVTMPDMFG